LDILGLWLDILKLKTHPVKNLFGTSYFPQGDLTRASNQLFKKVPIKTSEMARPSFSESLKVYNLPMILYADPASAVLILKGV